MNRQKKISVATWQGRIALLLTTPWQRPFDPESDPEVEELMPWYYEIEENVPEGQVAQFVAYSRDQLAMYREVESTLEKKADWLMTLCGGVIGVGLLRVTGSEDVHVSQAFWFFAEAFGLIGMWLCLKARMPQPVRGPATAREFQKLLNSTDAWLRDPCYDRAPLDDLAKMYIAKADALAALTTRLICERKAESIDCAGFYLAISVVLFAISFGIPMFG